MKDILRIAAIILYTICALSCSHEKNDGEARPAALFELLSPQETGIHFQNNIKNQKDFNIFKYRNFYNGGGVALGDINNDGLIDIYFTGNMVPNKLYLNKGEFVFEDITKTAGVAGNKPWSTGVTMADINADGLLDIYVSNAGNMEGNNHDNDLYINNGDLTFTEKAAEYNLAKTGFSTHASFFDYDKDGDLDVYILNNSNVPVKSLGFAQQREVRAQDWNVPKIFSGVGDMLLRNDGNAFTDVSEEAGIYGSLIGFGLGVLITDINHDLYPDIYISNDFYERDYLYLNNQDGTFTEDITSWTNHLSLSAMGVDIADINNDGLGDIFITDMLPEPEERVKSVMEFEGHKVFDLKQTKDFNQQYIQNTLQLNNGNNSFSEIAYYAGVSATDWSWSGLLFDMNNDGYRDIYITNGINHDLTDLDFVDFFANDIIQKMALTGKKTAIDSIIEKMPSVKLTNYAYKNTGGLKFEDVTDQWGFETPSFSNGAAYGDLDNDGDLDLVVNNVNMPSFVYRNNASEQLDHHYVRLSFKGDSLNPFAVGTKVNLYQKDRVISQELIPSRGFQSSIDYTMSIGLGDTKHIDSLRVIWPNGKTQLLNSILTDTTWVLDQSQASHTFIPQNSNSVALLKRIEPLAFLPHQEDSYSDFDVEGMINRKISQEGPALAVGDFNNDGIDDFFLGGARKQPAVIYKGRKNNVFQAITPSIFQDNALFEDVVAIARDLDQDGDLDIIVGAGGNNINAAQQDAVYIYRNDGNFNFVKKTISSIRNSQNISAILPIDQDKDGDLDLLVFSRSLVGIYGANPSHYYLQNDGNLIFSDQTQSKAKDLKNLGMCTGVSQLDNNHIIVTQDWGSPQLFEITDSGISLIETNLNEYSGFWNSVETADLDNDGDHDVILGNHGQNIHYSASGEHVLKLWVNDFDNNGTIEQIMTRSQNDKDYPIHQKKELTSQLVSLKKKNLKASVYSKKSIQELFSEAVLKKSIVKTVNFTATVVAINQGEGNFDVIELPPRSQLSCVNAITTFDVNKDGYKDIILGGNNFDFKPQYSRLDASQGEILFNNEGKTFEWQPYSKSGLSIKGEISGIEQLNSKNQEPLLIFAVNNEKPVLYQLNE